MGPQGRREARWVEPGTLVAPAKGKRLLRTSEGRRRMKFCLRAVGVALFVSCPYLYILLTRLCAGMQIELLVLVLFPVLLEAVALFIHRKGM